MKKIILALLLFSSISLYAQKKSFVFDDYLSINTPYKFNLPVQGLSLSMPAKMGFMIPKVDNNLGFLDMNDNVDFFAPSDAFKGKRFKFSSVSNGSTAFSFFIYKKEKFFANTYLERIKNDSEEFERIPSIKNDLGESVSFRIKSKSIKRMQDVYIFYKDGYIYDFTFFTDITDSEVYRKVIKSIKIKNFKKELSKYHNRINKLYEKKQEEANLKGTESIPKYRHITGVTDKFSSFLFIPEDLKFDLPSNTTYRVDARKVVGEDFEKNIYKITSDFDEKGSFTWIRNPQGSFVCRSYLKKKDQDYDQDFKQRVQMLEQLYRYTKAFTLSIEGIKCNAVFSGSPYIGGLDFMLFYDDIVLDFSIQDISLNNINYFDKILSSLQIKKKKIGEGLTSILHLEKMPDVEFEDFRELRDKIEEPIQFPLKLKTVGAVLNLPGSVEDYTYGVDTNLGKDALSIVLNKNNEFTLAPSIDEFYLALSSEGKGYTNTITIYPSYGSRFSARDMMQEHDLINKSYKTYQHMPKFESVGILTADDGVEWAVAIMSSGCRAQIYGGNDAYHIHYMIKAESPEILNSLLALTYKFKIV